MMRTLSMAIVVVLIPVLGAAQASAFADASADTPASAQAPADTPASAEAPADTPQGQAAKPSPLEPQGYTYEPAGRRDPFVSLVRRGDESAGTMVGVRPPGLAGMATSELALRGTIQGKTRQWIAILQGVDGKNHLARAGDKLFDGTVRAVTADSMVIVQDVKDPLSLETQREVRKVLRQTEEAR
jgi:hypothetical protein